MAKKSQSTTFTVQTGVAYSEAANGRLVNTYVVLQNDERTYVDAAEGTELTKQEALPENDDNASDDNENA